jgi:hypothetical protein
MTPHRLAKQQHKHTRKCFWGTTSERSIAVLLKRAHANERSTGTCCRTDALKSGASRGPHMVCTVCGAIGADARREVVQQIEYTRDSILAELEEARQMAIKLRNPSAAWQAAMAKAKILGPIIDRREAGDVGAFDALTDEELVALAAKKARELGLAGPQLVEDDKSV